MNSRFRCVLALAIALPAMQGISAQRDFDGDGRDDVVWRNADTGANALWPSANPASARALMGVTNSLWKIVGAGDFNGDGNADLLWRNRVTGQNAMWRSGDATQLQAVARLSDTNWRVRGIGDFDGDGRSDVLWTHPTNSGALWPAANAAAARALQSAPARAIGDFDGDGRDDLLVMRPSFDTTRTLAIYVWPSADSARARAMGTVPLSFVAGRQVQGVGDFDGDGRADVFWRNWGTGENVIWRSANPAVTLAVSNVPDRAWNVAAVGDFDGDGRADLFWRHAVRGYASVWPTANVSLARAVAPVRMHWGVFPYEGDAGAPLLVIADSVMPEGNSASQMGSIRLHLSHPASQPMRTRLALYDDFGGPSPLFADSTDFTTTTGMDVGIMIPAGETVADLPVQIFGDTTPEANERFYLFPYNTEGAVFVGNEPSVRILNDDANTAWIEGQSMWERNAGLHAMTFTVRLSRPAALPASFVVATTVAISQAEVNIDYQPKRATLTIAPGATTATFVVAVVGDQVDENHEALGARIESASGAMVVSADAIGYVYDDDGGVP